MQCTILLGRDKSGGIISGSIEAGRNGAEDPTVRSVVLESAVGSSAASRTSGASIWIS